MSKIKKSVKDPISWTSVEDALPPIHLVSTPMKKVRLWVYVPRLKVAGYGEENSGCRVGFFFGEGFWMVEGSPSEFKITHWMPLPGIPLDRAKGGG